jgi:hypothetical protein
MTSKRKIVLLILLLFFALLIRFLSLNSHWVETVYSKQIYPIFGSFFRYLFGWLPISIGDILYTLAVLWLITKLYKGIKNIVKRKASCKGFGNGVLKSAFILLFIYVVFNGFWGVNYNRKGIAHQLNLKKDSITKEDVIKLNQYLVKQVNSTKISLLLGKQVYPSSSQLFKRVEAAYKMVEDVYPFLHYKPKSIKPSMWGWLGNYMGFTGYYNPFTGEAQVNTTVPKFVQPFTTQHEVAHQLGYAKENEANFVGFLAGIHSADTLLLYSTYLDMLTYSNRNLFWQDTLVAKQIYASLIPQVVADKKELREFNKRHTSFFEPIFRGGYSYYLKRNNQPQGLMSYDAVTNFLVWYYKREGVIEQPKN